MSHRRGRMQRAGVAAVAAALVAAGIGAGAAETGALGGARAGPANVVVVMTDDQDVRSLKLMPHVRSLLGRRGTTFTNSFASFPLCCPSRATFLTGQYAHNHGVLGNHPPNGGFRRFADASTLPVWLRERGYVTGLVGKYLNGYGVRRPGYVPPGWGSWAATGRGEQNVYRYPLHVNGRLVRFGRKRGDYKQDVLTRFALEFIQRRAGGRRPFFLFLSYTAPHAGGPAPFPSRPQDCDRGAKPAPRHAHVFDGLPLPRPPSFDEADVSDKPPLIRALPRLSPAAEADIARQYRCRMEALQSVDEGVRRVVSELRELRQLDDTNLIFTSDNGFLHGEHRIPTDKGKFYQESIRVPLLARGPAFEPGARVRAPVVNADLAPTIAELAGAEPGHLVDGVSLVDVAADPGAWAGREILLEAVRGGAAIRTRRYLFGRRHRDSPRELYDLRRDPYELRSRHRDPAYNAIERELSARLDALRACAGPSCR